MTPAEEDAIVAKVMGEVMPITDCIRLAIRAAVAHERERAAKVAADAGMEMEAEGYKFSEDSQVRDRLWARSRQSHSIAAAIRRGE